MGRKDPKFLFELRVNLNREHLHPTIIRAYDGNTSMGIGCHTIDIEVRVANDVVFPRGQLYCGLPAHDTVDGVRAKELVMATVAMKPGDTDADFFVGYTPDQLDWVRRYGDKLDVERRLRYCDPKTGEVRRGSR